MTAGKYDITIEQGSDFSLSLTLKQNGLPRQLAGYTARGSMRKTYDDSVAYDFTFNTLANDGVIVMEMTHAVTALLDAESYVYDLEIYTGTGSSNTLNGEANLTFDGSTLDVTGDLTLSGDLTVNGTTTTIATTNLQIQDAFGFFATGSAGTNVDAGIIVQSGSFVDSGSALYHDISSERWSVGKGIASTATNVPDSKWGGVVATVYTASASPVGSSPKYGVGEIHVDDDGEIYIYS